MGINEILPGCEKFESWHTPHFYVGMRANLKEFGNLVCVNDDTDVESYSPREHPSFGFIKKGEKLKFKELSFNYMTLRCVTDKGHIAVYDCVGNFMVQKITQRFIVNRWEENTVTMYERIYYIDSFGNKWAVIDENDNLVLTEILEPFWIFNYVDKPEEYINEFSQEDYSRWRNSKTQTIEKLYYWNAQYMD